VQIGGVVPDANPIQESEDHMANVTVYTNIG
jgi:hypothetical protein